MLVCPQCKRLLPSDATRCPEEGAAASAVEELPEGTRIGGYRTVRLLGEGGMGWVYEAVHEVLGRRSAIKLLRSELTADAGIVTRFLQEARAVNQINHDNVISVFDFGDGKESAVYFVMEYLEGETLGDLLSRRRRIRVPLLAHIYGQIMRALAAAHAHQIVHRDLKPANVFLVAREDNPFFVKLLDFGVARIMGEGAVENLTRAGALIGTPQYMSPEQVEGKPADPRSDVFALGVMLYRSVVGHVPFAGQSFGELAARILAEDPVPPHVAAPDADIPESLARLITRAMHKNPARRFPRVVDMLAELERVSAEAGYAGARIDDTGEVELLEGDEAGAAPSSASLARSMPIYQQADPSPRRSGAGPAGGRRRARLWLGAGVTAAIAAAVAAALLLVARERPEVAAANGAAPAPDPAGVEPAGAAPDPADHGTWLRDAIASRDPARSEAALDAIDLVGSPRLARLVYPALDGAPGLRVRAAEVLRGLGAAEAAPRVREVMSRSGDRIRIELAATLLALGDRDGTAILERALEGEPGGRLVAAVALARAGEVDRARPVLEEVFADTPAGRERWRRAAGALARLEVAAARAALAEELAHRDPARSVPAAAALAEAGDPRGPDFLERVVADDEFPGRAEAALALARAGTAAALGYVADGLASEAPRARAIAAAIAARFAAEGGGASRAAVERLAASDPDERVRAAARAAALVLSHALGSERQGRTE